LISCHMFEEVRDIASSNPQTYDPNDFFSWLAHNYATAVALGIRKLMDHDKRSLSLVRLLEDILANRKVVTRASYAAMYRSEHRDLADRHFTALVGGKHKVLPPGVIKRDLRSMIRAERRIRIFVNKKLAHLELNTRRRRLLKYGDLIQTVQLLESFLLKYRSLLSADAPTTLLPTWQYNWKQVFFLPWITDPDAELSQSESAV
jgi:hypothetical protein